jgi:hypothetical protein
MGVKASERRYPQEFTKLYKAEKAKRPQTTINAAFWELPVA